MISTDAPDEPKTLRDAVVEQIYEIDALERDLIRRYEREEEILKILSKRDAEIQRLKKENEALKKENQALKKENEAVKKERGQLKDERQKLKDALKDESESRSSKELELKHASNYEARYRALADSRLGSLQRRWWKLRSGKNA